MHHAFGKLKTPLSMDQGRGAAKSGPNDIPKLDSLLSSLSTQGISAQTKISIMQQATYWTLAAKYPWPVLF